MTLVAGVDSSTQSCKVVVRDAETGRLVRSGAAPHPDGTEVHPDHWWTAFQEAAAEAGGLEDVAAISVGGQQHGMVTLDPDGEVVRPALLWNDTRSARAAEALNKELGPQAWAEATGSVLVASFTITKLRWLAENEPEALARTAAVCLPHDWLSWKISGSADITTLVTDRSDASGTGYWSAATSTYRTDLLERATGRTDLVLPRVLAPAESGLLTPWGAPLGAGAGDNAGAALGLGARPGDVILSVGTSGVVSAVSPTPTADATGTVAGFADATGHFLPLVATLNAARVLAATAGLLGVDLARLEELALSVPSGADGLTLVPYLEGERTPNLPDARGAVHGLSLANSTPAHFARAAVEGLLCGLADGVEAMTSLGVPVERILMIGGGAKSRAVRQIAPAVLGRPVVCPEAGEYVADGAARQAAWALTGDLPEWELGAVDLYDAPADPAVREQYAAVSGLTIR